MINVFSRRKGKEMEELSFTQKGIVFLKSEKNPLWSRHRRVNYFNKIKLLDIDLHIVVHYPGSYI